MMPVWSLLVELHMSATAMGFDVAVATASVIITAGPWSTVVAGTVDSIDGGVSSGRESIAVVDDGVGG